MKRSSNSEEKILYALKQAESGTPVGDVCRQMGISEATFYVWKKKYGGLSLTDLRELRQLREENSKLKRLVADLTRDRPVLTRRGTTARRPGTAARSGSGCGSWRC
jgi:putative transposase